MALMVPTFDDVFVVAFKHFRTFPVHVQRRDIPPLAAQVTNLLNVRVCLIYGMRAITHQQVWWTAARGLHFSQLFEDDEGAWLQQLGRGLVQGPCHKSE